MNGEAITHKIKWTATIVAIFNVSKNMNKKESRAAGKGQFDIHKIESIHSSHIQHHKIHTHPDTCI